MKIPNSFFSEHDFSGWIELDRTWQLWIGRNATASVVGIRENYISSCSGLVSLATLAGLLTSATSAVTLSFSALLFWLLLACNGGEVLSLYDSFGLVRLSLLGQMNQS